MRLLLHMGDPYVIDNPCTKRMRTFKKEFEKQGHKVIIMAPETVNAKLEEGVIYCKTPPLKKKTSFYRLINGIGFATQSIKEAKKIGKIDFVLTTCPPPLINIAGWYIARRKHAKLIYDVRDIWPDVAVEMGSFTEKSIYYKVFDYIKKFMVRHADIITAVSNGKVEKLSALAKSKKIICISNGFYEPFLENSINENLYNKIKSYSGIKCIYVGNLGLAQGLMQLLEIAEKCKVNNLNASFVIYGSGAEEKQLKEYVHSKKLDNVHFEGRLPNKDMYTVLKAGDFSFVPLVNANLKDSIPTKLYESLGVGCPVLLAAEGDSVKVLEETGFGVAVSPYNSEELWNGFLKLFNKEQGIFEKKDYAMEIIRDKYSLHTSAKKLMKYIDEILGD